MIDPMLAVRCPFCLSAPGAPCTQYGGGVVVLPYTHAMRREAAELSTRSSEAPS